MDNLGYKQIAPGTFRLGAKSGRCVICGLELAEGQVHYHTVFDDGEGIPTYKTEASGYSYHKKDVQPLRQESQITEVKGKTDATGVAESVNSPAPAAAGDFIAEARRFFEADLLPICDAHIGPGGWYFLPPRLIEDYSRLFEIMAARERGFVRLVEVLSRYCEKIDRLKDEVKEAREIAKGLLNGLTDVGRLNSDDR
jgi:hypothetical protein